MYEGMFTQPGEGGMFGRGGEPQDGSSPVIDSDDNPLRETLIVAYPSPGHLRVARAKFDARSGQVVEMYEEYREPAADEVEFLRRKGVIAGPGSIVQSRVPASPDSFPRPLDARLGAVDMPSGPRLPPIDTRLPPGAPGAPTGKKFPWVKVGVALAVGAAGLWAVNRYVVPRFSEGKRRKKSAAPSETE